LLTRLNADVARALSVSDSHRAAHPAFETTLKYMLFVDEARLPASVRGVAGFAGWFANGRKTKRDGRFASWICKRAFSNFRAVDPD
jgi:hypothetical protein